MIRTRYAAIALSTALGLGLLGGCGGDDDEQTTAAAPAADAAFNAADVTFVQQMIPHHSQAVKMAALAETRSKSAKVKKLADEIIAGQGPEIETLQGFLATWNQPSVPDMASMDHSNMRAEEMAAMGASMPGMARDADMTKLAAAKGAAFDTLFLALMLKHHQGAVQMTKTERSGGKAPEAISLAEDMQEKQNAEISTIRKLQKTA